MAGRPGLSTTAGPPHGPDRSPPPAAGRVGVRPLQALGIAMAVLGISLVGGVTTASVEQSLGPHEARYSVTTDDLITVDLGPLGTVEMDSPLPLTLGVEVRVEEIPRTVTAVDPARTIVSLGQDLAGYVQFFTGPQATIEDAARGLVMDALRRAGLWSAALAALALALRALLGPARRHELATALTSRRAGIGRAGTVVVVVAALCVSSAQGAVPQPPRGRPSPVFDDTPLEGARITGRLAGVVDTYGSLVVDAYRENEAFYGAAQSAVAAAWDQRAQAIESREQAAEGLRGLVEEPLVRPTADAGAPATDRAGADGDAEADAPADDPTDEPAEEPVEPVVVVLVADLHCNVGMARVIRTVAERAGADLLLNAGDTTVNGTSVERYCVSAFARAVPPGVPKVVADGNHDSLETAEHERQAGWTVLDGQVVEVAGVRVLGDRDPNQTRIGGGTAQVSDETAAESGERLARVACDDGAVDVLLVHTPSVGRAALESGCVPVQLSGHKHRRVGPEPVGRGVRYVSSTTAGATSGGATVGPLNGVASLTVLRFDPAARRMLDVQVVEVAPDGTATVGPREPWGTPLPVDGDARPGPDPGDGSDEDSGGIPPGVPGRDEPAESRDRGTLPPDDDGGGPAAPDDDAAPPDGTSSPARAPADG